MSNVSQTPAPKTVWSKFGDDVRDEARKKLFETASVLTVDQIKEIYERLKKVLDDMTGQFLWPAVRTAHKAMKVKEEHFVSALFVKDGIGTPLSKKSKNWDDLADPYDQLDLQAWCRYLRFGKDRVVGKNQKNATDQDAFFDFLQISLHHPAPGPNYNHWDFQSFGKRLEEVLELRNLIAHGNYAAGTLKKLSDAVYALHKILSGMNYVAWGEDRNRWQKELLREFYDAIGEIDYTVASIVAYLNEINCAVPAGKELVLEMLLIDAGMAVVDHKISYSGNIEDFIAGDLAEAWRLSQTNWNEGVSKIRKASQGTLPAYGDLDLMQKVRVNDVLKQYTDSMKDLLVKAVKEAHRAYGVNVQEFADNLFIEDGTGKLINGRHVDTRPFLKRIYRSEYKGDPYTWLDLQGWLKYLLLGGCRLDSNGNHVKDQDTVFYFLGIPPTYNYNIQPIRLTSPIAEHLSCLMEMRNYVIDHATPTTIEQTTTDAFVQWYKAIMGLLTPMCKTQWNFQDEAIRHTEDLKRDFFEAAGFAYSLEDIFEYIKYSKERWQEAEQRLVELGFPVCDGKVTIREDIESFMAALPVAMQMTRDFLRLPEDEKTVTKLDQWIKARGRANEVQAVRWFEKAAKAQPPMPAALYYLGCCALYGRGVEADEHEAMAMICSAAKKGYAPAQVRMGQYCEDWKKQLRRPKKEDALQWYQKAAVQEYADGLYHLGRCYRDGIGIPCDENEAYHNFWDAEQQGHLAAKMARGKFYEEYFASGLRGETDYEKYRDREIYNTHKAEKIYQELVAKDYVPAMIALAMLYSNYWNGLYKPEDAKILFRKAVVHGEGDASALRLMGEGYLCGGFLPEEIRRPSIKAELSTDAVDAILSSEREKGCYWLRLSAEEGDAKAMRLLGECYRDGFGVEKNVKTAFYWTLKAAEKGDLCAISQVAFCYDGGIGVQEDKLEALQWYQRARDDILVRVRVDVGEWKATLKLDSVPENERLVACQQALWVLMHVVDVQKDYGYQNMSNALFTYELADMYELALAEQAKLNPDIQADVTRLLKENPEEYFGALSASEKEKYEFVCVQEEDLTKAVELYKEAANAGLKKAMRALGRCYEQGIGVDKNLEQAIAWYQKAVDAGDIKAMLALGDLYQQNASDLGDMMDADTAKQKAIEWYLNAHKKGVKDTWQKLHDLGVSVPL